MSHLTGLGVEPVGQDVLRHVVAAVCLAVAVLSHGAILRSARAPGFAALVPWLVVLAPTTVEVGTTVTQVLSLQNRGMDVVAVAWHLASYPTWPAVCALLAADGVRSTWRRWSAAPAVAVVAALACASWWAARSPGSVRALERLDVLRGWELGPLRAVLVAMTVCAAIVAGSRLAAADRWSLALGCSVPAVALAVLPTLLTTPQAMVPAQRWTVVLYPLAVLAAAAPAAVLARVSEIETRRSLTLRN